jgi:hypothetical protein
MLVVVSKIPWRSFTTIEPGGVKAPLGPEI